MTAAADPETGDLRRQLRLPQRCSRASLFVAVTRLRDGRPRATSERRWKAGAAAPCCASAAPESDVPCVAGGQNSRRRAGRCWRPTGSAIRPESMTMAGRHRHQRQDHHHLSAQGTCWRRRGGQGGPDRHQPEHDRRGDPAHRAHHAGVLRAAGAAPPDGGRGLHPCGDGGLLPRPGARTGCYGIRFAVGIFTNLTQDHLDFHKTMEAYCDAKALPVPPAATGACSTPDDPWAERLHGETPPARAFTYSEQGGGRPAWRRTCELGTRTTWRFDRR